MPSIARRTQKRSSRTVRGPAAVRGAGTSKSARAGAKPGARAATKAKAATPKGAKGAKSAKAPWKNPIPLPVLLERLEKAWPHAHCELNHANPFQLLVATILSAQCTDVQVNKITPALFQRFPTPKAMAEADLKEIESLVKSTGFFRNKAKNIQGAARKIVTDFGGQVPDSMDALLTLPGVARKTGSVVLGNAFGKNEGIAVDTHVTRLTQLWGITREDDPKKIEQELMAKLPREKWTEFSHQTIFHGRRTCAARNPDCANCMLRDVCPSAA
ncbi:MAG TPA: endonuclease III [bacterium]|nr:endonuclease III [bacterium]